MRKRDHKKSIFAFVKSVKPRRSGHTVVSKDEFADGVVAKVNYQYDANAVSQCIIITSKFSGYADTESQLIQQINAATAKHAVRPYWYTQIFNVGGLIALLLVITSSYLIVATEAKDVPEFLKAALLTIVGFYFSGYVNQHAQVKPVGEDG